MFEDSEGSCVAELAEVLASSKEGLSGFVFTEDGDLKLWCRVDQQARMSTLTPPTTGAAGTQDSHK